MSGPTIDFAGLRFEPMMGLFRVLGGPLSARLDHADSAETRLAFSLARPGDRVVVGGAGYGGTAALLTSIVGTENLLAYEPNPQAWAFIRDHVRVDGKPLEVVNAALGDETAAAAAFYTSSDWMASSLSPEWAPGEGRSSHTVPVYRLADVLRQYRATGLLLDIERAELTALPDAGLGRLRWLVVEWHDPDTRPLIQCVTRAGMEIRTLTQGERNWVLAAERTKR